MENAKTNQLGVVYEFLFKMELAIIIIDELHLFLRVTDILLSNVLWKVVYLDEVQNFQAAQKSLYLENIVKIIKYCGLSFEEPLYND